MTAPANAVTGTTTQQAEPQQLVTRSEFEKLLDRDVQQFSAFGSVEMFADAQRMAKMLCASSMVPESFRGDNNLGNCVIALEIANRIGASVLAVMQNIYIVHGKPGWSAQFLISCLNASRRFTPLRFKLSEPGPEQEVECTQTVWEGREKKKVTSKVKIRNVTCIAWANDKSGERLESPEVSIDMAVKEGWYSKDGSKWKTMEQLMLRYRAATFFVRLYAPELTMGIQTAEELEDITPNNETQPFSQPAMRPKLFEEPKPKTEPEPPNKTGTGTIATPPPPVGVQTGSGSGELFENATTPSLPTRPMLEAVKKDCDDAKITGGKVIEYAGAIGLIEFGNDGQRSLSDFTDEQLKMVHTNWAKVAAEIRKNL